MKLRPLFASGKVSAAMKTHGAGFTWSRMNMNRNLVTHVCLGFFSPGVDLREAGARDAILKCWDLGVLKVKTIP